MNRGEIWWASLPDAVGSMPGYRRPFVIIQSNAFNRSRIQTIIVAVLSSNLRLAEAPGNVILKANSTGLPKDSVVNVSQIITVDKLFLTEQVGAFTSRQMEQVESGMRLALSL